MTGEPIRRTLNEQAIVTVAQCRTEYLLCLYEIVIVLAIYAARSPSPESYRIRNVLPIRNGIVLEKLARFVGSRPTKLVRFCNLAATANSCGVHGATALANPQ